MDYPLKKLNCLCHNRNEILKKYVESHLFCPTRYGMWKQLFQHVGRHISSIISTKELEISENIQLSARDYRFDFQHFRIFMNNAE